MLKKLPEDEDYPNIQQLFGIDINQPDLEKLKKSADLAKTIIQQITTFRTDLNKFREEEKRILEAIGYTLAAYRYR